MAWNPLGPQRPWDSRYVTDLGTQAPAPKTGIEENQGFTYPPDIEEALQVPQAFGLNVVGWQNPYSLTFYQYGLSTSVPTRVLPNNIRRTYLIMQNQGPGNIWINFGQDVSAANATANSNGLQLIQTQFYEQIGGGDIDYVTGYSRAQSFVSPDYLSVITDVAGTTILLGEGVWRFVNPPPQSIGG